MPSEKAADLKKMKDEEERLKREKEEADKKKQEALNAEEDDFEEFGTIKVR
jgi:hypothetical protein